MRMVNSKKDTLTMDLEIRFSGPDDFQFIFNLLKQLWPDSNLDYGDLHMVFQKALGSESQRLIVGLIQDQIVGFCSMTLKNNFWQSGNLGFVDELIVDKKFRGQGIGKSLLEKMTSIAKENGCKRIELDSAFHRKEAHVFYEKNGFESRAYLFSKKLDT